MTKIVWFLCAVGLLATMLGSSALWSQDAGQQEATKQEAPKPTAKPDESSKNKESATASEKKTTGDFKPSEEISEDFPVPLPSDI